MKIPNAELAVVDIRKLRDIVEILANGEAFEVEFSGREGYVYESLGLRPDQMMRLRFEPTPPTEEIATTP